LVKEGFQKGQAPKKNEKKNESESGQFTRSHKRRRRTQRISHALLPWRRVLTEKRPRRTQLKRKKRKKKLFWPQKGHLEELESQKEKKQNVEVKEPVQTLRRLRKDPSETKSTMK